MVSIPQRRRWEPAGRGRQACHLPRLPWAAQQGEFQQRGPRGKLRFSPFPWQPVFSKPEAAEDPCGGSLQTCREAAVPAAVGGA